MTDEYSNYTVLCDDCKKWYKVRIKRDIAHDDIPAAILEQPCECKEQTQSVLV